LAAITRILPSLKGFTLVFYPCIPKCLHRKDVNIGVVEGAADGVGQDLTAPSDSEGTDGDVEMHDFGRDGTLLPEVVTRVHAVKSNSQRAAQLAADHLEIDTAIGLADIEVRYPKRLTFLHAKNSHGDKDSTQAFLLIPTEDLPGINTDSLKESIMFQSGTFSRGCPAGLLAANGAQGIQTSQASLTRSLVLRQRVSARYGASFFRVQNVSWPSRG